MSTISPLAFLLRMFSTPEDFFKVIDVKAAEWLHKKEMRKYLRPQTLFGPKFEAYLNEAPDGSDQPQRKVTSHEEIEAMKRAEGAE